MPAAKRTARRRGNGASATAGGSALPGQVVLVLQGGGALGAYQVGVYEAMHEAGVEPDWVIGTSIGAINAALIAGNAPQNGCARLQGILGAGRAGVRTGSSSACLPGSPMRPRTSRPCCKGIPAFFTPNPIAWLSSHTPLGVDSAAYYTVAPLKETLADLIDLEHLDARKVRLTVGAVNVRTGEMRYFDSRDEAVCIDHVLASGALPPAFPAVLHRRRTVLGRRHLFEHADRGRARRQAAPGFGDLRRADVESGRPGPGVALAGDGTAEGHPVRESRQEPHRAAEADPSSAPHHPRDREARAGKGTRAPPWSRNCRRGAAIRRCTSRVWSRRRSMARITRRTSISRRPAFARAGRRATPIPRRC